MMRFSLYLLLMLNLSLHAESYAQVKKISVTLNDATIDEIIRNVRQETNLRFLYRVEEVNQYGKINFNVKNVGIDELMKKLLEGTHLSYEIENDVVIISPLNKKSSSQETDKNKKARGYVKDASGSALPGATIRIKGTQAGTVTDGNGAFLIELPDIKDITLIFSFVGMRSEEIKFAGQEEFNITLYEAATELDQVVKTGYQTIDKRKLTSAISTVKADQLEKMGALTIDQMLEGKAPGLMITNLSAQPGAATKLRVRSGGTFTGTREPLWVIDGVIYQDPVPLNAAEINSLDNVNLIGNAITGLNPQDIAQIDILKDASATAIYGTKAANGVIVITTKRGKEGTLSVNYSGTVGVMNRPRYSDMNLMNSKERIDVSREIYMKNLAYPTAIDQFLGYEGALQKYFMKESTFEQFQQEVSNLERMNTDWFDELYRPAINHSHSVNLSGGSDRMRYYASVGYDNQQGTEKNVGLERFTARSNMDFNVRKNFLVSLGITGSIQEAKYNHSAYSAFDEAYYTSRAIPVRDNKGDLVFIDKTIRNTTGDKTGRYNILQELNNSAKEVINKDFNVTASANWEVIKNLKLSSQFSYRNTSNMTEEWINDETFYIAQLRTYDDFASMDEPTVQQEASVPFGGIYSSGLTSQKSWSIINQINYSITAAEKHHFNLNLGQEATSVSYWGSDGWKAPGYNHSQGRSFIMLPGVYKIEEYGYQGVMSWLTGKNGLDVYPAIIDKVSNTMSFFGIFNYSFDDRYIFNFNMRSDGSNSFGQYQRYKFRPAWSTSVRWNIHSEKFMQNATFIDELALRLSYGFRGTPPAASPYMIIGNYGRYNTNYNPENVADLVSFPNANLKWERTSTLNAGLNHSWLGGRISGAVDYSYSKSVDLLLSRPISLVNGSSTQLYNAGSKEDHTFELNLITQNIKTEKFQWNMNLNISRLVEKILDGFEEEIALSTIDKFLEGSIYMKGFPVDGFYSYRFDGLDKQGLPTFEYIENQTGSYYEQLQKALVYEGNRLPKFYGGFGTEFRYADFTLSANFSYKAGHKIRLLNLYNDNQSMPMPHQNMSAEFNNRWQSPGDEANTAIPGLSNETLTGWNKGISSYVVPYGKSYWWMYDNSDERTVKGDYIRWQSLTLAYKLPDKILSRIGVNNVRIAAQVQNLAVWAFDKKLKGQDPEQVRGVGMPVLPSYNLSLNFSF